MSVRMRKQAPPTHLHSTSLGTPLFTQNRVVSKRTNEKMKQLLALAPLLLGLLRCCVNVSLEDQYPFSEVLRTDANGDPLYTLHWNFSVADEMIAFGVNVSTNGWVGLGISPTGGMINSDVAIGWVNDEGQAFFHASCQPTPSMLLIKWLHAIVTSPVAIYFFTVIR